MLSSFLYSIINYFYFYCKTLTVKRKYYISAIIGCSLALIQPPFNLFFILFIAPPLYLILLEDIKDKKQILIFISIFYCSYYLINFYWTPFSIITLNIKFQAVIYFILLILLIICLAIPSVGIMYLHKILSQKFKLSKSEYAISYALFFFITEIIRIKYIFPVELGHGWPWNLVVHSLSFSLTMMQIMSILGAYAMSLILILLASLPYIIISLYEHTKNTQNTAIYRRLNIIILLISLIIIYSYGAIRLQNKNDYKEKFNVRLVDAEIAQHHGFDQETMLKNIYQIIDLATQPAEQKFDLIIMPESAIPNFISKPLVQNLIMPYFRNTLKADGNLLLGSGRLNLEWSDDATIPPNTHIKMWNSALLLSLDSQLISYYDKIHLVPFGEYMPYSNYLKFIKPLTNMGNIVEGDSHLNMEVNSKKFSPLICFDAIFSGAIMDTDSPRPDFLVNITNDLWFKFNLFNRSLSTQPYQHFYNVRLRSIEEGLPLLRVANLGITALISPYGEILQHLDINEKGALDFQLPSKLPETFFAIYGNKIPILIFLTISFLLTIKIIYRTVTSHY